MKAILIAALLMTALPLQAEPLETEREKIDYEIVTEGLVHPWSVAFLPGGGYLITERPGRLRLVDAQGHLHASPIGGLPAIAEYGQGGLLDVALHPDFENNRWVYLSYAERTDDGVGTAVARGRFDGSSLRDTQVIFRLLPKSRTNRHFGSRLVFDRDGYLFITLGDRGDRPRAQDLNDHAGSVIRLHDDGRIPDDNPYVGQRNARPEIYSYGHRNMQGATLHPGSGKLWTHEHGPQGGDEINLPQAGYNYGWPVITYGVNYGFGTKIGEGTAKPGMQQPLYYWVPSIAPSGMAFYDGDRFPNWQGNLFVGSLKFDLLVRLEIANDKITHEERLFEGRFGRIRDVRQGPDGYLYLLSDARNGKLIRLRPANGR